jgi:hypothetical protein
MIVYHLCRAADAPKYLAGGLTRSDGRHYVFDRWVDIRLLTAMLDVAEPGMSPASISTRICADGPIAQLACRPGCRRRT